MLWIVLTLIVVAVIYSYSFTYYKKKLDFYERELVRLFDVKNISEYITTHEQENDSDGGQEAELSGGKNPTRSEEVEEGMCGICPNVEQIQREKFDYYVPLTDEDRKQTKHTEALPLSFMQIKEGDVDSGILWYKQHYPKVPDELI
eukprot:SAG11_NODE_2576_length_3203_cov_583.009665_1_plen_145_part_10